MKPNSIILLGLISILTACSGSGTKFFINNHETQPVSVQYKYYSKGQYADNDGFDYPPKKAVMTSKEIRDDKVLKNYPFYNTKSYFDSLQVTETAPLTYHCYVPAKSTTYIAPIHQYGDNIEYVILNKKDTIRFTPHIKANLVERNLITSKKSLLGNNWFCFDIKLKEIESPVKK